jgi:hypothetical protein
MMFRQVKMPLAFSEALLLVSFAILYVFLHLARFGWSQNGGILANPRYYMQNT